MSTLSEEPDIEDDSVQEAEAARVELDRFRKEMVELQAKMPRPLQRQERRTLFFQEFHEIVSRHWISLGLPRNELLDIFSSGDSPDELSSQDGSPSRVNPKGLNRCKVTM
jgi:hypothetical protein